MTILQSAMTDIDVQHCRLVYRDEVQQVYIEQLKTVISHHKLWLTITTERITDKLTQKRLQQLSTDSEQVILFLDSKNRLSWLSDGMTVTPEWDKLQQRVVRAGRKSELLLQAAKLTADSYVIDATAGFGHDSLVLASTGAHVTMLEQQPLMALLLLAEQQRMSVQPNWQKLMSRLHIINTDALSYFATIQPLKAGTDNISVVYLDPMFPEDSYQDSSSGKGAKVGKHMQALHQLARPPTLLEEQQLLTSAQKIVNRNSHQGRVIVKRPQQAPLFAHKHPDETWQNSALRFDGYLL